MLNVPMWIDRIYVLKQVLAPSAVWISIAVILVTNIWAINGKEPLYPVKKAN